VNPTSRNPEPRVAVILLTVDQRDTTLRCLESLARVTTPSHRVWLWDNGSTDGTAEAVARAFPAVRVHRADRNLGVAAGRNAAAAWALGEEPLGEEPASHLLFLDNDMTVEPDFLRHLLAPFADDERLAQTTGKIRDLADPTRLYGAGGCRVRFWRGDTNHVGWGEVDRGQYDQPRECLPSGGCMLVPTGVFRELGGFDEIYSPYGPEDLDFGLRARARGWRARYVPGAVVYHASEPGRSFGGGAGAAAYTENRARQWLRFLHRHATPAQRAGFYLLGAPWLATRMLARAARRGRLLPTLQALAKTALGNRQAPETAPGNRQAPEGQQHIARGASPGNDDPAHPRAPEGRQHPSQGKRPGRWKVKLFLLAAGTLAGLLLCEGVLRLFAPQIFPPHPPGAFTLDREVGYLLTPGFEGCLERAELEACFTTGAAGLRGADPRPRRPGTVRILVLGDSMAWGYGVADDETFPHRLERSLAESHPGRDVQVLNGAVPGYGTADQLAWLQQRGAELDPDVVIVQFFSINDFEDNRIPARLWATLYDGMLTSRFDVAAAHGWPWSLRVKSWLKVNSHLFRLLSDRLGYLAIRWGMTDRLGDLWQNGEDFSPEDAERTVRYLREIAATAEELGATPLFLFTTGQDQVLTPDPEPLRSAAVVERAAAEAGVPWLDVTPRLRRREDRDRLFYPRDGHWTATGHRAVAEILHRELVALGYLETANASRRKKKFN